MLKQKEVEVTFPEVQISVDGKVFVQPTSKEITQDVSVCISTQIAEIQKLLDAALNTYTVEIKDKASLRIETTTKIKQTHPSLPTAALQNIEIRFNSRLHKQLYKVFCGWKRRTKSKDILYFLQLINNKDNTTALGRELLYKLNEQGPGSSIRDKIALALCMTHIDNYSSPIKKFLVSHFYQYMYSTSGDTTKEREWLQQNAEQLLKSKLTPDKLKIKLLPYASLEVLPQFLASSNEATRLAAKIRYDELKTPDAPKLFVCKNTYKSFRSGL